MTALAYNPQSYDKMSNLNGINTKIFSAMPTKESRRIMDRLLEKQKATRREMAQLDNQIFKLENAYLELVGDTPITRNIEYYLNNRTEKKKAAMEGIARVFSTEHPREKRPSF